MDIGKRKDRSPDKGASGSFEWHNKHLYGSMESEGPRGRSHTVSPGLAFKTEKDPMVTFRNMLKILARRDFSEAFEYNGPELGLSDSTMEMVPIDDVLDVLQYMESAAVPFGGFRCVLVYDKDDKVKAKLKVKSGTSVKLKVKGTIVKSVWDRIRADVKKKFRLDV
jgi:hypothetical protein